jgi:LysR family transcriptional regulator, nod-box dependent transcriptional activator
MRYRRLGLNLLIALEAMLSEKSVTRAAAKLHMTQPAMSGALARLRENLDDQLLVLVGRQFELTPRAEMLLEPVRDIILRVDSILVDEAVFDPKNDKRHFIIVASDYVIRTFLIDVLRNVYQSAPGISFEFRHPSNNSQAELGAGDIDFLIAPEIDIMGNHPSSILFEDTYSVIAWTENSILKDSINFNDFMALGHVIFRSSDNSLPWLDRWFINQFKDARQIECTVHSFDLIPYMVAGTDLIATMPAKLAYKYAEYLPLKLYMPPMELPALVEVLQWNSFRDEDPAIQWFKKLLEDAAHKVHL